MQDFIPCIVEVNYIPLCLSRSCWMTVHSCWIAQTNTIWCISYSSQLCTVCRLAESTPSFVIQVITEGVDSTGSSVNLWGTLLVTFLLLDFVPLIITLWGRQLCQFPIYPTAYLPNPSLVSLSKDVIGDCAKSLTRVKVNSIHCSNKIHRTGHLTEGDEDAQHDFLCTNTSWPPLRPLSVWKWFPGQVALSPSQGLRWSWWAWAQVHSQVC